MKGSGVPATDVSQRTEASRSRAAAVSVLTVCPFCSCGCGLYLQTAGGELTGVMPSDNHPVSRGRLCARGWAAHEASLWGRRLTSPLVRNGGTLEPATWRTALTTAAERLNDLLAAGKPVGVLGSARATNEENFLAVGLARAALGTNHVDSCLRAPYQCLLSGISRSETPGNLAPALQNIEKCDVILLLEEDLAITHPQVAFAIMRAVRRGAKLVTMGPIRTQMSRLAWLHISVAPADQRHLIAALAAASGGDMLDDGVQAADAAPSSASLSGSHQADRLPGLERALEAYKAASNAAIVLGSNGTPDHLLREVAGGFAKLADSTGHLRRSGSVILPLPHRCNTRGALEMGATPHCLPGLRALDNDSAQKRLQRVWGREIASERGLDVETMLREVKGLMVVADDPPLALLAKEASRRAMAELECLIVLDAFVTQTVEASHIALPISSLAEVDGTITNMEGRVQWLRACRPPPGEARPGWCVLGELGTALGMSRTYESVQHVSEDILAVVPEYAEAASLDGVLLGVPGDWPGLPVATTEIGDSSSPAVRLREAEEGDAAEFPYRLLRVGAFEWGEDTYVDSSPTLSRDHRSRRKLHPDGYVEMGLEDAKKLGVRHGWRVKIVSTTGEVVIPVQLREDIEPGIVLVPFAFRDQLAPVSGRSAETAVNVERT